METQSLEIIPSHRETDLRQFQDQPFKALLTRALFSQIPEHIKDKMKLNGKEIADGATYADAITGALLEKAMEGDSRTAGFFATVEMGLAPRK